MSEQPPGAFRTGAVPVIVAHQPGDIFDTLLTRLAETRRLVNQDIAGLYEMAGNDRRLRERADSARHFYTRTYLEGLRQLARTPRDELQERLAETQARLERGWAMESSDAVDDLFVRLTLELEVLSDALDMDAAATQHRERIERIIG